MSYNEQADKNIIFFESKARLNTKDNFIRSILQSIDLVVLNGESGTGKTIFLDKALRELRIDIFPLMLRQPGSTFEELINALYDQINFSHIVAADEKLDVASKQAHFMAFLDRQAAIKRQVSIFIDDAQVMTVELLTQLLKLATPPEEGKRLFNVVLSGSRELNFLVLNPQVISIIGKNPTVYQLNPLGAEEIKAFMRMRLSHHKYKEKELFSPLMLTKIMNHTQGALRLLDSLFDSVILFADSNDKVTLAGFNEAFDFFTLLVMPSMTKGEAGPKSLFYGTNEPASGGLAFSLKEKVIGLVNHQESEDEGADAASHSLIAHEPFEYAADLDEVAEQSPLVLEEGEKPAEIAMDSMPSEEALAEALPEVAESLDSQAVLTMPASVEDNQSTVIVAEESANVSTTDELEPLVVAVAAPVNRFDAITEMNMSLSLMKTDDNSISHLKMLIAEYHAEMSDVEDFPSENIVRSLMPVDAGVTPLSYNATPMPAVEVIDKAQEAVVIDEENHPHDKIEEEASAPLIQETAFAAALDETHNVQAIAVTPEEKQPNDQAWNEARAPLVQEVVSTPPKMTIPFLYAVNSGHSQEKLMNRSENLKKALQSFKDISPDVEAAALISDDGLIIASVLSQDLDEVRVGGMSATLLSLGTRCASELKRGKVTEVIVRGEYGYAILMSAGRNTMLLAVTHVDAKLGLITFDMREAVAKVTEVL